MNAEQEFEHVDDRLEVLETAVRDLEISSHALLKVMERVEHRLFGNGQPGELDALRNRVHILELANAQYTGRREGSKGLWETLQPFVLPILGALIAMLVAKSGIKAQ